MIQLPANADIVVMHEAINFHKSFDGTIAIVRTILQKEPMDGAFFVFRNKMGHTLRIMCYDGGGFWLCMRRLSSGTFNKVWPKADTTELYSPLLARELMVLIWGGDPMNCAFPELWRRIA
jgi:transposase